MRLDAVPSHASAIVISPDGRHLYVSNRGHDSIAAFAVQDGGALAFAGAVPSGGRLPWVLDWAGEFLLVCTPRTHGTSLRPLGTPSRQLWLTD